MCAAHIRIYSISLAACAVTAIWALSAPAADANQQNVGTQNAYQPVTASAVRLQVSGTSDRISLDAERADVQSVIKAVLKQSGKQFAPDSSVTGQVTLLLTDQPLQVALRVICDGSYLRYSVSPTGIYHFSRDDDAVKKAFTRLAQLNAELRGQLRSLGFDMPAEEQFGASRLRVPTGAALDSTAKSLPRDEVKKDAQADRSLQTGAAKPLGDSLLAPESIVSAGSRRSAPAPGGAFKKEALSGNANIHAYLVPQGEVSQFLNQAGSGTLGGLQDLNYLAKQNGFVWFNISEEKPEPVASVLQLFSRQSNVPILVDQSIPNSLKFRVWGSLSARHLPEALNVLAPTAHLQWRWIGNTIFVVPAPSFQVFFGDLGNYRSQYPAPSRGETGGQGAPAGRRGGSD